MLTMKDLPYPNAKEDRKSIVLTEDCLLDDTAFSNRATQIAKSGETLTLYTLPNFGVASHKLYGIFRY